MPRTARCMFVRALGKIGSGAPRMTDRSHRGLSYREAGVDIDATSALVESIKPLARATRRPGADADLGGFGALFDLKAAGFKDPLLVAANDGVGTKLKLAIELDGHDGVGIDLVAMCVNDLIVQGAEPLFFLVQYGRGSRPAVVHVGGGSDNPVPRATDGGVEHLSPACQHDT